MVIVEERVYTLHPGKLKAFIEVYTNLAKPIQWPILGEPIAFLTTEIGELHQVVHLWRYASFADREERRAKLAAAPNWGDYLAAAIPLFQRMETRILTPLPFSPLQ